MLVTFNFDNKLKKLGERLNDFGTSPAEVHHQCLLPAEHDCSLASR